ncbi:M24 family metallopeptidase [Porifericola rhodea]|uniref:M24 family metallopeptidase n=1 Tax=Porifericola rhodea TaxID=930972 RepID=UPI0026662F5D|nr:M24 family metallopeptidase [Porifericola rhodea]WKN33734.1 M24 family metallopeptidase [Porifericola rhodea]
MRKLYFSLIGCLFYCFVQAQSSVMPHILPLKERATIQDQILEERFNTLLPKIMEEEGIDLWLVMAREYNEDPIIKTMLPSTWLSARRRTILAIHHSKGSEEIEGLAIARYNVGELFTSSWNPEEEPDQWKRLAAVIAEKNPQKIAINTSEKFNHTDGLTSTELQAFMNSLPKKYKDRVVSAEPLAVRWLETRTDTELALYEQVCRIAHTIIAEGLSEKVIQPGVTTTEDVKWWYRERIAGLKLEAWFHPTVDVTRADPESNEAVRSFSAQTTPDANTIMPGDLVHIDFGITYLRLNTDMQQNAYVLKPGETAPPEGLSKALAKGNRLQDILTSHFKEGRSGNEVLKLTRQQAIKEGLVPSIYSHPIGYHGHAAGPAIGMWDNQEHVPSGEHTLYNNTCYAIELNTREKIPEWGNKEIRVMLEETAVFKDGKVHYIDGRQKDFLLIPRSGNNIQ